MGAKMMDLDAEMSKDSINLFVDGKQAIQGRNPDNLVHLVIDLLVKEGVIHEDTAKDYKNLWDTLRSRLPMCSKKK